MGLNLFIFQSLSFAYEPKHDGFLRLYHSHLSDFLEVQYEKDGAIIPGALEKINHFMRSRDSGQKREMDPELIRLLDHLQDHFKADTVEVICGYRSPRYNAGLKKTGHHVADNSLHMRGIAADIHLDEITEDALQRYARSLRRGGVGYYPDLNMVHVDLGRLSFWQEDKFSNKTDIGVFNKDLDVSVMTDKPVYFSGQRQKIALENPGKLSLKPELSLERFHRGKWQDFSSFDLLINNPCVIPRDRASLVARSISDEAISRVLTGDCHALRARNDSQVTSKDTNGFGTFFLGGSKLMVPHGKFRWKLTANDGREQYSNEFYLKKK